MNEDEVSDSQENIYDLRELEKTPPLVFENEDYQHFMSNPINFATEQEDQDNIFNQSQS
jgi:hypothetical protein